MISCGSMALTAMRGGAMTQDRLAAIEAGIYGAGLIGLGFPSDAPVDGGNYVTSWPWRVGPALVYGTNSSTRKFSRVVEGNRVGIKNTTVVGVNDSIALVGALTGIKSLLVVYNSPNLATDHHTVLTGAGVNLGLVGSANSNNWWNFGTARYVDGVLTNAFTPNTNAVSECLYTTSGIWVGGRDMATAATVMKGTLFFARVLSVEPTAAQRAAEFLAISRLFK